MRLWVEALGEGKREVRMQIQQVTSGETRYFRTWAELISYLATSVSDQVELEQRQGGIEI
jgi:hypothetical protein